MSLSQEQKEHAIELIQMGDQLEAVRYLQQTLGVSADQALLLAEKLEEEVDKEDEEIETELKKKLDDFKRQSVSGQGVNVGRLVGTIFMVLGSIMLAVIGYISYSNFQFSKRAIPVMGEVLTYDNYYSTDSDGGRTSMYTPTYGYSYNGKKYTYTSSTSSSSKEYEVGEKIEILVDPDDPESVLVNAFWERWLVVFILGFLGTMFTGMGYMAYAVLGKVN